MPHPDISLTIRYPDELPVSQRKDDILAAVRDHQVVVVAGETGSGKTTQLPKICLELGRGSDGRQVAHTQPRRIAARTVAERIADELGTDLGDAVGYQVRFTDRSSTDTRVKVMTDGILLAEIQRDRELRRYDTVIIDEAHERSLNIDFILGYLKQLLPRRPDLKVIITSATIDPERFSRHFDDAPVVEVSGRTYPVEVRYRPLVRETDEGESRETRDQPQAIVDAVRELMADGPGDILVFCSGEREIRDAAEALAGIRPRRAGDELDVLPLFARLSSAEQRRVFQPGRRRRVVLATNVAETSLTVPGIHYVVDTGLARISRYSARTKVQRLPIEPISQASADQRKGRCGRLADGICIRLYSEEDFEARPAYTDPEILRTSLASVILQMTSLGLGDLARFPFVEPPDPKSVRAGLQLLEEIGAITTAPARRGRSRGRQAGRRPRLTAVGKQLVQMPVDPRLGRMMVEAARLGCLREVVVVVSALSMQDPRERPADRQEQADAKHARFRDADSDFAAILHLWTYVKEQQEELSSSAFRRMCGREYLNYLRVREWQDLDVQLRQAARQAGLRLNRTPAAAEAIHRALITGLLSHIGIRDHDKRDYQGARGTRFSIFPGSGLFKKQPDFVMAAELVETSRLYARQNAGIDPAWAEEAGEHLVKRSYSEPHWEKSRGSAVALEKVTLYGVPLVTDRRVSYGRINPAEARELFIREALVAGEWETRHQFWHRNQQLLAEAEEWEHRARRRGIVVDDETLVDFYAARVPDDVVSVAHFDRWWKDARAEQPDRLSFTLEMLVHDTAPEVHAEAFPEVWHHDDVSMPLDYEFDPGSDRDGVTVEVPVSALNQVSYADFTWPVPGMRAELVTALIRSLPKRLRRNVVPAPDYARRFLEAVTPGEEPLTDALERFLRRETGEHVTATDWDWSRVPAHLRMRFRVVADDGRVLDEGGDLDTLKAGLTHEAAESLASAAGGLDRRGMTSWDVDVLPREFSQTRAGHEVRGYPCLVDAGDTVDVRVLGTQQEQDAAMLAGTVRLLRLVVPSPGESMVRQLDNATKLVLGVNPDGTVRALLEDCWAAAVRQVVLDADGPAWDRAGFVSLTERVRRDAPGLVPGLLELVRAALEVAHEVDRRLSGRADLSQLQALSDLQGQYHRLLAPGFVEAAGAGRLRDYPRYLRAMLQRLDSLTEDPRGDAVKQGTVVALQDQYLRAVDALPDGVPPGEHLAAVRWLLEELRVSLWAQSLGTRERVSATRVQSALDRA